MTEHVYIGSCPADEDCVQVSSREDYMPAMKQELKAYRDLLRRAYPEPDGATIKIKQESHEFGPYLELVVMFDPDNEEASEYAYELEGNTPATWEELMDLICEKEGRPAGSIGVPFFVHMRREKKLEEGT